MTSSANGRIIFRLLATVTVGLAVGVATATLQKYLDRPWGSLANSASPWLTAMFAVGAMWSRPLTAAMAGLGTGLLELAGYYLTSAAKGYSFGDHSVLVLWGACAVVGGLVFGAAGSAWWRATKRWQRSVAGACLPAAFLAEAVVVYGHLLHYWSSTLLFGALAFSIFVLIGFHRQEHTNIAAWLLLTVPAGVVAELVFDLVYREAV
jgi:hypothetical protein